MECPCCQYNRFLRGVGATLYCVRCSNLWRPDVTERDPLLVERQQTHGSFDMNAIVSQRLKEVLRKCIPHYGDLMAEHAEALDMICLKISRIMSGQATFKDHWDDIAGYAKLGAEACER